MAQAERCMASCQAVAIAMGVDLRQGIIACTLYAAQEGAQDNLAALESAFDGFLNGNASYGLPEHRAEGCDGSREGEMSGHGIEGQEGSSEESGGETAEGEEEGEFVDSYLRPPDMPQRTWHSLTIYLVGLPALYTSAIKTSSSLLCVFWLFLAVVRA
jgi:hypothetical protein